MGRAMLVAVLGAFKPFAARPLRLAPFLVVILAAVALAQSDEAPPAMIVPGAFAVSPTGAATYTIPISAPPGTGSMVPVLSLDYSSQNYDGLIGLGWVLDGLPAITRCPRTLAQDNIHGSVNYDGNDRFCLGGQRLILTSGTYGADGSQYRTEIESFSKVIAHGSSGSGPAWFEVHTKSGNVMEFGNTIDSQVLVVSAGTSTIPTGTVREWEVDRETDTSGNYFTVIYNCGAPAGTCTDTDRTVNGEAYPLRIDYTGNAGAGVPPYNSIQFTYAMRTDVNTFYQAGGFTKSTVVLTDIKTYETTNMVFDYHLVYRTGTSRLRSHLTSVTLCDNASHCLPPATFGWQGITAIDTTTSTTTVTGGNQVVVGDWNGDGLTDYSRVSPSGLCFVSSFPVYLGQASFGFTLSTTYTLNTGMPTATVCSGPDIQATVFAPDGSSNQIISQTDYLSGPPYQRTYVALVSSAGAITIASGTNIYGTSYSAGDFNGDGLPDYFSFEPTGSYAYLGNTSGTFNPDSGWSLSGTVPAVPADFDGDGCTDMALQSGTYITYSPDCNPAQPTASVTLYGSEIFGDFNGDGKTDYIDTAGNLYLSTGTGFVRVSTTVPVGGQYATGDWNGDGKADLLVDGALYLSTGTGFVAALNSMGNPVTVSGWSTGYMVAVVADWDNDGNADILAHFTAVPFGSPDTFNLITYTPELMVSVSNGIGSTTNIAYDRINKGGSLYTKGTSGAYPTQDMIGPQYVVSRVDASDGLGTCNPSSSYANCYSTTYAYVGAQRDLKGRGFLGFLTVAAADLQTNITDTANYDLTFPYIGMISSRTKTHAGNTHPLYSLTNTLSDASSCGAGVSPPAGVHFVCISQSIESGYDLNDTSQLPQTTTAYTFDNYGNALTVNASTYDPSTLTTSTNDTTNTYSNNTTSWFLGRLATTAVNKVVGSSNLTRHSSFSYSATTGLLTEEVIEPSVSTCNAGSDPCTVTTDYTYDAFGHRITTTVSGSGIATRGSAAQWDLRGEFQSSATNALGQTETWTYNAAFGGPVTHTDLNALTTNWTYDTLGRLTQETRPDGTQTTQSYTFCSGGCPTNGQFYATRQQLGPTGSGSPQIGPTTSIYYDMLSRVIANDTQGYDGSDIRVATRYDANERVQQVSRPYFTSAPPCPSSLPCWTSFAYDDLGRVTQTTYPDGHYDTNVYAGLTLTAVRDAQTGGKQEQTITVMNPQRLIGSVTDPLGSSVSSCGSGDTTCYAYDAFGDVVTVTDPAGHVITNTFDVRGHKTATHDPDLGSWSYIYDVVGEMTSQTDAKGQSTNLTYDFLGRVLSRSETGLNSTWIYGANSSLHNVGHVIEAKACAASGCSTLVSDRTFGFDSLSRESSTTLQTPTDYYGYYLAYNTINGKIDTVQHPSGFTEKSLYNGYGYLCRLANTAGTPTCTTNPGGTAELYYTVNGRDAELHLTQATEGNGVVLYQTFDPKTGLMICTYTGSTCASSGTVASLGYTFDTLGNLTSRTDSNESYTENFCYDRLNRLTNYTMASGCGGKFVVYTAIGNILSKSDTGLYGYGSALPHAVTVILGTVNGVSNPNYHYDSNGNLDCEYTGLLPTGCSGSSAKQKIAVTSFNMADTITIGSSATTVAFTYDAEHSRIKQVATASSTTTTTLYLNDPASGAMSERVTVGSASLAWTDYLTLDGKIIAQRASSGSAIWGGNNWGGFNWSNPVSPASWQYFVLDNLGSIAVIADQSGIVTQRVSFDAWGKPRNPNGTDVSCGTITSSTTRGFTNQEQVPVACLANMNARLYDPIIGRFEVPDSTIPEAFNSQSYNRYSYVNNGPLSFTDPTGMSPICTFASFCGAASGFDFGPSFVSFGAGTLPGSKEQDDPSHYPNAPTSVLVGQSTVSQTDQFSIGFAPATDSSQMSEVTVGFDTAAADNAGGETVTVNGTYFKNDFWGDRGPPNWSASNNGGNGTNGGNVQVAQAAMGLCVLGPGGCAVGAGITAGQVILGGAVVVGGAAIILHNEKSPDIDPSEVAGKKATEIDEAARAQGLIPKGPDPANGQGAYVDPVTGEQRILVHPDPNGGGHVHVNDPSGQRLDVNGNPVDPNSPAAHLPLGQ